MAKKALLTVNDIYLHNFFKREEIMKKIEEHEKQQNQLEKAQ
jgi:hypothetical protein